MGIWWWLFGFKEKRPERRCAWAVRWCEGLLGAGVRDLYVIFDAGCAQDLVGAALVDVLGDAHEFEVASAVVARRAGDEGEHPWFGIKEPRLVDGRNRFWRERLSAALDRHPQDGAVVHCDITVPAQQLKVAEPIDVGDFARRWLGHHALI